MNRIKLFFTFMLIALLCAGAVSASSDVDNVTTVELNNFEHVAIDQVADEDQIDNIQENTDDVAIDDNETQNDIVVIDEVNDTVDEIQTVEQDTVQDDDNSTYSQIMKFLDPNYMDFPIDYDTTYKIYENIIDSYGAGHSTKSIAAEVNMTQEQVQNIADCEYKTIQADETANQIYYLYGTHTLEEMANELGLTNEQVLDKIHMIKRGEFGDTYKKLFLRRDLVSTNFKTLEFIIK